MWSPWEAETMRQRSSHKSPFQVSMWAWVKEERELVRNRDECFLGRPDNGVGSLMTASLWLCKVLPRSQRWHLCVSWLDCLYATVQPYGDESLPAGSRCLGTVWVPSYKHVYSLACCFWSWRWLQRSQAVMYTINPSTHSGGRDSRICVF